MDGKILIVDDVATNRILLKVRLHAARYCPMQAATGAEALRLLRSESFDLVLLDLILPDLTGIDVLRRLRADPATANLPVIVLTATSRPEDRLAALAAGADDVFAKPTDTQLLLSRIRNLLRDRQKLSDLCDSGDTALLGLSEAAAGFESPGVIGLIASRPEAALHLRHALQPHCSDRLLTLTPDQAIGDGMAPPVPADIFLIDGAPPLADGGRALMSDLLSRTATRQAGVCLLAQAALPARDAAMAFDLGASDVLHAEHPPRELALRLRATMRRKRYTDRLLLSLQDGLRHAVFDPVTGLHNRRYALARLQALLRQPGPLAVIMADLDMFKSVNDRFGHAAGDHVLTEVGRRLSAHLGQSDVLARFGGEEFLILLPEEDMTRAQATAETLCRALAETPIPLPGGQGALTVTASFGLACRDALPAPGTNSVAISGETLLAEADRALMQAKAQGRNTVRADTRRRA